MNPQTPRKISIDHCLRPLGNANARVVERWRGLERDKAMKEMNVHHIAK